MEHQPPDRSLAAFGFVLLICGILAFFVGGAVWFLYEGLSGMRGINVSTVSPAERAARSIDHMKDSLILAGVTFGGLLAAVVGGALMANPGVPRGAPPDRPR